MYFRRISNSSKVEQIQIEHANVLLFQSVLKLDLGQVQLIGRSLSLIPTKTKCYRLEVSKNYGVYDAMSRIKFPLIKKLWPVTV